MFFKYEVPGWINTQVIEADSFEEALENVPEEAYGLTQISQSEYETIRDSWRSR